MAGRKTVKESKASQSATKSGRTGLARYARSVAKTSGKSQYSSDQTMPPSSIPSVLCPVANAHGGQDGVIPPGVAAQLGLYRKIRLRPANLEEAAAHQRELAKSTVREQYEDLYESIESQDAEEREAQSASEDIYGDYGEDVGMFSEPPAPVRARPARKAVPAAPEPDPTGDTLDDFYEDLKASPVRTANRERSRHEERLELENEDLKDMVERLKARVSTLKGKVESQEAELAELREARDAAEPEPARPHTTVRVMIGEDEEKILIGGRGSLGAWQSRIMGHVDRSRDGSELCLTVRDPAYASEVLGSIENGRVTMVTRAGRIECEYDGLCHKLYAADGDDFIAVFGFRGTR